MELAEHIVQILGESASAAVNIPVSIIDLGERSLLERLLTVRELPWAGRRAKARELLISDFLSPYVVQPGNLKQALKASVLGRQHVPISKGAGPFPEDYAAAQCYVQCLQNERARNLILKATDGIDLKAILLIDYLLPKVGLMAELCLQKDSCLGIAEAMLREYHLLPTFTQRAVDALTHAYAKAKKLPWPNIGKAAVAGTLAVMGYMPFRNSPHAATSPPYPAPMERGDFLRAPPLETASPKQPIEQYVSMLRQIDQCRERHDYANARKMLQKLREELK